MAAARARVTHLLRLLQSAACQCPTHSHTYSQAPGLSPSGKTTDYAFEMAVSNIRYGAGVTKEVGMDLQNMGAKNVCLMTDKNLSQLPPVRAVLDSLVKHGITFRVYDAVRVEPTDASFMDAIEFARKGAFDAYVAVGGGSAMDTCKAANLYACSPHAELLDYVNAPIGKARPVTVPLRPLVAVPTTSGTGSETTGVAIFDYESLKVKTECCRWNYKCLPEAHLQARSFDLRLYNGWDPTADALPPRAAPPPVSLMLSLRHQGAVRLRKEVCVYKPFLLSKYL